MDKQEFERRLEIYRQGVEDKNRAIVERDCTGDGHANQGCRILLETYGYPKITLEPGSRYVRVVREHNQSRSVHTFIDKTNGDVLKSATWKAPAKHARGNIFNDDNGLNSVDHYGAHYLR
jgi:hypothetical protein